MKKIIQKITAIVALSACLVNHAPVFATTSFDQNKEVAWRIGIKMWGKNCLKIIMQRYSTGLEFCIGPFVEYKPLDSIGIQTGLLYGYNNLFTAGFNWMQEAVDGWSGNVKPKQSNTSSGNRELIDVDKVQFHAITIPCSIRWYPRAERQFLLHGGLRFVIPLSKAKQCSYGLMAYDPDGKPNKFSKFVEFIGRRSGKKFTNDNDVKIKPHLTLDFGVAYNAKCGFIIGTNGFGLELGYDFTKFLIQV